MLIDLSLHEGNPELGARTHFAKADLGHFMRNRRGETIAAALAAAPGQPIPQLCARTDDIKAAYTQGQREL